MFRAATVQEAIQIGEENHLAALMITTHSFEFLGAFRQLGLTGARQLWHTPGFRALLDIDVAGFDPLADHEAESPEAALLKFLEDVDEKAKQEEPRTCPLPSTPQYLQKLHALAQAVTAEQDKFQLVATQAAAAFGQQQSLLPSVDRASGSSGSVEVLAQLLAEDRARHQEEKGFKLTETSAARLFSNCETASRMPLQHEVRPAIKSLEAMSKTLRIDSNRRLPSLTFDFQYEGGAPPLTWGKDGKLSSFEEPPSAKQPSRSVILEFASVAFTTLGVASSFSIVDDPKYTGVVTSSEHTLIGVNGDGTEEHYFGRLDVCHRFVFLFQTYVTRNKLSPYQTYKLLFHAWERIGAVLSRSQGRYSLTQAIFEALLEPTLFTVVPDRAVPSGSGGGGGGGGGGGSGGGGGGGGGGAPKKPKPTPKAPLAPPVPPAFAPPPVFAPPPPRPPPPQLPYGMAPPPPALPPPPAAQRPPPQQRDNRCFQWAQHGRCSFGANCRFDH